MADQTDGLPNFHALLIGIDYYFPGILPDGNSYPHLYGAVRDIGHVNAYLQGELNIPGARIARLTSPHPTPGTPSPTNDPLPTYENLIEALRAVTDRAKKGDQVYVHYSGHGGRVKTVYPAKKGARGVDEALVPWDIHKPTAQYFRDLEFAELLRAMTAKGLYVTLVLDCCYSGGATRGISNGVGVRGVDFIDMRDLPAPGLVTVAETLTTRGMSTGEGFLPEPKGYTLLAACRSTEKAREFRFDGKEKNGALTYWLLDVLRNGGTGLTYKMVFERVFGRVQSHFEEQSPMLEGEPDREFFGVRTIASVASTQVLEVDLPGNRVRLGTGTSVGVLEGARFAIYPQRTASLSAPAGRKALVEVTENQAVQCWAALVSPALMPTPPIVPGDEAVLLGAGFTQLKRRVRAIRPDGSRPTPPDTSLLAVEKALAAADNGWVSLSWDEPADFLVDLDQTDQTYRICDKDGDPMKNLRPALKAGDSKATEALVERLVHLAKYRAVQELENFDLSSPLRGRVVVEWIGWQEKYVPLLPPEPKPFVTEHGQIPALRVGQTAWLRVRNDTDRDLNIAILDLSSNWKVSQAYPGGQGLYFDTVPKRSELLAPYGIPLTATLPEGATEGFDILKVMATVGPSNFRVLELPELDQPISAERGEARTTRGISSALDRLLESVTANQPATRALKADTATSEWTTVRVQMRIVR
jgi:Caspase domain